MQIPFDVPQAFDSGSSPEEKSSAKCILRSCLARLRKGSAKPKNVALRKTGDSEVTFDLPEVFFPGSSRVKNSYALHALMHCLIALNLDFLKNRQSVITIPPLYDAGIVYDRTLVWDTIPALYSRKDVPGKRTGARRYGDCKSLTAALVAQYRMAGLWCVPVFRFLPGETTLYHILAETDQGYEDPSKVLGMLKNENSYFQATG
jgi:hypothetical protein